MTSEPNSRKKMKRLGSEVITSMFDPKPVKLEYRFLREDPSAPVELTFGPVSTINFPEPGLTLLLGKNGSGKTNLLRGTSNLAGVTKTTFPEVSVIFDWPSADLMAQWHQITSEVFAKTSEKNRVGRGKPLANNSFYIDVTSRIEAIDLPLMSSFLEATRNYIQSYPSPFSDNTGSDVLEYFDFSQTEIQEWIKGRNRALDLDMLGGFESEDDPGYFFYKYKTTSCIADAFLNGISTSSLGFSYFKLHAPVPQTDDEKWVNDAQSRNLFVQAFRSFFGNITNCRLTRRFESVSETHLSKDTSSWNIQFLSPIENNEILRAFYNSQRESIAQAHSEYIKNSPEDSDISPASTICHFPFNMLSATTIDGKDFLQSQQFSIPDIGGGFSRLFLPLTVKSYENLKFEQTTSEYLSEQITENHLNINKSTMDGNNFTLVIEGYEKIRQIFKNVGQEISNLGMGIDGLRIREPFLEVDNRTWKSESNNSLSKATNPFALQIEWRETYSTQWLPILSASRGQQDVITLFLELHMFAAKNDLAQHKLFLIDEFDKHLHSRAAESVLVHLHNVAHSLGISAIASTHSVPLFNSPLLLGRPRIFAMREITCGGFEYSDSNYTDPTIIAEILGVEELEAFRFKDLIIIVEGEHDEKIISRYLEQHNSEIFNRAILTHTGGLDGWEGTWNNALRMLNCKILFVHDKRDEEIENRWLQTQDSSKERIRNIKLDELIVEYRHKVQNSRNLRGWHEKKKILYLLSAVCKNISDINRVEIFGMQYDDIVDALPIKYFLDNDHKDIRSWSEAHEKYKNADDLKKEFGITTGKILNVLNKLNKLTDPELERLNKKIVSIIKN